MKKVEYFVNWLFYVSLYFEKLVTRFLNYFLVKPILFFFSKFVPKRFHPPGIKHPELREEWNEIYDISDAIRITYCILFANTLYMSFVILYLINDIIDMSLEIRFVLSVILALPWWYFTDSLIYKDDKYLVYFRFFEKKSSIWKRISLILGVLAMIESIALPVIVCFGAIFVNCLGYSL